MEHKDWPADYAALTAADRDSPLPPEDLDRLAVAAFVLGYDDEVATYRERAHEEYLIRGDLVPALRDAAEANGVMFDGLPIDVTDTGIVRQASTLLGPDTPTLRLYTVEASDHGFSNARPQLMQNLDDALHWVEQEAPAS